MPKKPTTRAEVDARIDYYISRELAAEGRRDALPWESPEYWAAHDVVLKWRERAVALMPKGS